MYPYKEVKNYMHNDLGITKEFIQEVIQDTVRGEVKNLLNDKSGLETLILNAVKSEMREAYSKNNQLGTVHKTLRDFNQLLSDKVDRAIYDTVKEKLYIGLKADE